MHHQDESVIILSSKHKYIHLKTHWASHTMHQNFKAIQLSQKLFYSIGPWSSYLLSLGFKMYFAAAAAFEAVLLDEAIGDANSLFDLTVLLLEMVLITMLLMAFLVAWNVVLGVNSNYLFCVMVRWYNISFNDTGIKRLVKRH